MSANDHFYMRMDIVGSTIKALRENGSRWSALVAQSVSNGDVIESEQGIGHSVHGTIRVDLTSEQIETLLNELLKAELRFGGDAVFEGRQINLLILAWGNMKKTMDGESENRPDSN